MHISDGFPMSPSPFTSVKKLFTRFPSVFWVVQSFELMERGAYYSMMPILAVHFIFNIGLPVWLGLILTVFMYPFQYGMPIFSSAFAEKVGYRKQMMVGFTVLFFAYIFLSFAMTWYMAILGVMLLGFGIGTYKPLVSSTIAKATAQADRNVAYSIYYWTVNLAATLFALIWTALIVAGLFQESMYAWVFRISSVFFLVNLAVAFFIFKEVPRSGEVKTVKDVMGNIKTAFKDRKFVVMIFLIAGFWALYSTSLAPFQTIMYGFHFLPESFPVILLGVFNPGTIILLGIPLSKYVEKLESLKVLMFGVIIYLIGLTIVAFFMQNPFIAVGGIVIYSIGEFMVAPGYLAFVSKLAPKEKISAYIGCNFLASFMGIWGGALAFGLLSNFIAVEMSRPHFFYGIVLTFGLLILVGFMVYYKKWGKDIIERAAEIKAEEEGIHIDEAREVHHEPVYLKFFDSRKSIILPLLIIPILIFSTYAMGTQTFYGSDVDTDTGRIIVIQEFQSTASETGSTAEGSTSDISITVPGNATWINVTVTWNDDESPLVPTWNNQPDSFSITLTSPDGDEIGSEGPFTSGSITLSYQIPESDDDDEEDGQTTWTVDITCNDAGDFTGIGGREPRFLDNSDNGNDWQFSANIVYTQKVEIAEEEDSPEA